MTKCVEGAPTDEITKTSSAVDDLSANVASNLPSCGAIQSEQCQPKSTCSKPEMTLTASKDVAIKQPSDVKEVLFKSSESVRSIQDSITKGNGNNLGKQDAVTVYLFVVSLS